MTNEQTRWEPGRTISAHYRVDGFLDEGAAGEVYVGANTWTGRKVAIKRLRQSLHRESTLVERFLLEGRIGGLVEHPNVVQTLDMGQEGSDGSFFIVQELLRGAGLREAMEQGQPLTYQQVLDWVMPLLGAVAAVHQLGVVHRDIKPENIILAETPMGHRVPKLLDFGIAKVARSQGLTRAGSLVGTVNYMAPEQVRGDRDIDRRVDVWAVGVLTYELLTGCNPFSDENPGVALSRIVSFEPPAIRDQRAEVPEAVAHAVERAIRKDRLERQESILHLIEDLLRWAQRAETEEERALASRHRISLPASVTQREPASGLTIPPAPLRAGVSSMPRSLRRFSLPPPEPAQDGVGAPDDQPRADDGPGSEAPPPESDAPRLGETLPPPPSVRDARQVAEVPEGHAPARPATDELIVRAYESLRQHAFVDAYLAAEQAMAALPEGGESCTRLRLLQAEAAYWLGENVHHDQCAIEALNLATPGSRPWLQAMGEVAMVSGTLGALDRLPMLAQELARPLSQAKLDADYVVACCRVGIALQRAGWPEMVEMVLGRVAPEVHAAVERAPRAVAWLCLLRAELADHAGDHAHGLALTQRAVGAFQEAGDVRRACVYRADIGNAMILLGGYAEAERVLDTTWHEAHAMGLAQASAVELNLGLALARQGKMDIGQDHVQRALRSFVRRGDWRGECAARLYWAEILWRAHNRHAAEREAKAAVDVASISPVIQAQALGMLSIVLGDRPVESLMTASQAMELLQSVGGVAEGESRIRLAYGLALERLGRVAQARAAYREAAERLMARADRISDVAWRHKFLHDVEDHARTIELHERGYAGER